MLMPSDTFRPLNPSLPFERAQAPIVSCCGPLIEGDRKPIDGRIVAAWMKLQKMTLQQSTGYEVCRKG